MRDAKGHGSDAHQAGVAKVGLSPLGNAYNAYTEAAHDQPLGNAWIGGRNAYVTGRPETENPHTNHPDPKMASEWTRGYKIARKHDRFTATIAARSKK